MIDKIQELMNHTKKDGTTNWLDGDDIKISLAGTFAADRFIVIGNESKKPWVPAEPHPRYDYELYTYNIITYKISIIFLLEK